MPGQARTETERQALLDAERTRAADLERQLAERAQQQAVTADVLRAISRAPTDLQQILDSLVRTAASLSGAQFGGIFRADGDVLRVTASYGGDADARALLRRHPVAIGPGTTAGMVAAARQPFQIAAAATEPAYQRSDMQRAFGFCTIASVPMLAGETPVGTITLWKTRVEPFADRQLELLQSFADQAVIAIENARLFSELQDRLAEQTATAEVLQASTVARSLSRTPRHGAGHRR